MKNSHLHPEDANTRIRQTSQKHWKQPLTFWGCRNKQRRLGESHRSIENSHLPAEDVETSLEGQVDFKDIWKTATYRLRMQKQAVEVRWSSQKHREQSLTLWGCKYKQRKSGGLQRSIEHSHLPPEDAETSREDHMNFTAALRTATYKLRMQKQAEKVRWTSPKHWTQPLTTWGCGTKQRRSDELHRGIENSHLPTKGADASEEGQVDFTEALRTATATYPLRVQVQAEKVRWTSQRHWTQPLTTWGYEKAEKNQINFTKDQKHLPPVLYTSFTCAICS